MTYTASRPVLQTKVHKALLARPLRLMDIDLDRVTTDQIIAAADPAYDGYMRGVLKELVKHVHPNASREEERREVTLPLLLALNGVKPADY